MAWLTDKTEDVTNTFTVGDINIGLTETTGAEYPFVPGDTLAKDPKVTVTAGSEDCWLFIKVLDANNSIDDSNNNNKIVNWVVNTRIWTPVQDHPGFWYKSVDKGTGADGFSVFTDLITTDNYIGSVKISDKVTKEMVEEINDTTKPTIQVTAAAVQRKNLADEQPAAGASADEIAAVEARNVAAAWAELSESFTSTTIVTTTPDSGAGDAGSGDTTP